MINEEKPLASVDDVFNAIVVDGNATGEVLFFGRGAGALPTASAVVSDIINIIEESAEHKSIQWDEDAAMVDIQELPMRYYLRCSQSMENVKAALGDVSVLQEGSESAFITQPISMNELKQKAAELAVCARWPVLS